MRTKNLRDGANTLIVPDGVTLQLGEYASLPTCNARRENQVAVQGDIPQFCNGTTWVPLGPTLTLGPWYAQDLAGTAADRGTALMVMTGGTAVAQHGSTPSQLRMPKAGRVVGAFLNSNEARTAGTATLRVNINGNSSAFAAGACVLNATNTQVMSAWDESGPALASGDLIRPVITTASWTPTTADVTAWLVVRLTP